MHDLTTGSISLHLLRSAGFIVISSVLHTLYVAIDLYWVSSLGTSAMAAVGISSNLMYIFTTISQALAVATTTLVSHASGRRDHSQATFLFNQAHALSVASGVGFVGAGIVLSGRYASALSPDEATRQATLDYLRWYVPATGVQFAAVAMLAALRATGYFRQGMLIQSGTVIVNLVLAPFLIFGWGPFPRTGVGGAAIATLVATASGVVGLSIFLFKRGGHVRFRAADLRPRLEVWGRMLRLGVPAGIESLLLAIYLITIYAIARPFGAEAQAGFGIGIRIVQSALLPAMALGLSVAAVAGQNFGAGKATRVRNTFVTAAVLSTFATVVIAIAVGTGAGPLMALFTDVPAVTEVGAEYLRIASIAFMATGVSLVSTSMFQSMGNTVSPLVTSAVRIVGGLVPAMILSRTAEFGLTSVWWSLVVSTYLQLILNLIWLRRELKRKLV